MRIALCQMDVKPGCIDANLANLCRFADRALNAGAELAVFPEMCLTGYLIGDKWNDTSFVREAMEADEVLRQASKNLALVYGNVHADPTRRNKDGRMRKYNAVRAWQDGHPVPQEHGLLPPGLSYKTLLPNYRVFDDSRYFHSLYDLAKEEGRPTRDYLAPFLFRNGATTLRAGLEVCEDLWYGDYQENHAPLNVSAHLIERGAEIIINVSASPWTLNKNQARHRHINEALRASPRIVPFVYVNCVGVQNNGKNFVTFDGRSTFYNRDGRVEALMEEAYREDMLVLDSRACTEGAELDLIPEERPKAQYEAISRAIAALDDVRGSKDWKAVIGLSGGVDSALSACLLARTLGPERVMAVNMPSRFNSEATRTIASDLARALGIEYHVLPIEDLVTAHEAVLGQFRPKELHVENIQAKIRGTSILSNLAGITGGLMINNGNKVEIALGYATLYGDVNGALAPLGDLVKTDVFALSHHVNKEVFGREMIPGSLLPDTGFNFRVPPSAELRSGQIDPMKWGYHDALVSRICDYRSIGMDQFGLWYLEGRLEEELKLPPGILARYGLDVPEAFVRDLEWFFRLFSLGVFKRIQAPPIVVTTRAAFGFDYRESQLPWVPGSTWSAIRARILSRGS